MIIKRVHHAKYLGLILDESLSFKEHIEDLTKQLNKLANSYKIVRYRVENNNKYNIYFAYTYSKIPFGIEVYGSAYMKQIQVQQTRSLKILFQKHYRTHTHDLYKNPNLLNVQNIKYIQTTSLVYKHKQGLQPLNENLKTCYNIKAHISGTNYQKQ